ncbi:MAG: thioredoxin domain-containing protein [Anaerolineae bacterium]|nr:thioredoxin domain-containing protein [Anaerolineae bacterium]
MTNRLAKESSPYLLQHAQNPVDWYPWGEEALARAKAEDKPIFLSIGYSACHWCHVMEHESFENERTAQIMNQNFINIKVDREERPDLDSIYMDAVVALTGQGGWPMSVFLTPEGVPFYGGTYYPPTPRYTMPSFEQVLYGVADAYHKRKEDVVSNGKSMLARMAATIPLQSGGSLDPAVPELALQTLSRNFDRSEGGLQGSPKFPQPMTWDCLLRSYHRSKRASTLDMLELTLSKMAYGGMYDQLGGGFHRYSVDDRWLVPHFEKMLYDNALLARLYLHAYQLTGKPFYRRIVEETLDYVMREMTDPAGGFYSTQDADSEGEEGKFFVWTPNEVKAILGEEEGTIFCRAYDITPTGNFEGKSIPNIPVPLPTIAQEVGIDLEALDEILKRGRSQLFAVREERIKPGRDEKILTAWNGLMLAAFAEAARVLDRADYLDIAIKNAEFILTTMMIDGRLFRTWKAQPGETKLMGYLEDYAFYADGLLALYQTTFEPRWFQGSRSLMDTVLTHFHDKTHGGFFDTADDHEQLVIRPKSLQDNATPCGNSMAVRTLLQLAAYTGQAHYEKPAVEVLASLQQAMVQYPAAFAHWLGALEFVLAPPKEVAIIGSREQEDTQNMLKILFDTYRPNQVVAVATENAIEGQPELVFSRPMQNNQTTAYVCQNFTCRQPVNSATELEKLLVSVD